MINTQSNKLKCTEHGKRVTQLTTKCIAENRQQIFLTFAKREKEREKVTRDPLEEGFEHIGDALLLIGQGAVLRVRAGRQAGVRGRGARGIRAGGGRRGKSLVT